MIFDRSDSTKFQGGDTIQIQAIKKFLISRGYHVDIFSSPADIQDYDEVFIFNLQRPFEGLLYANVAAKFNKPYIFFPVYWDLDSLRMKDAPSLKSFIKKIIPSKVLFLAKSLRFYFKNRKLIQQFKANKSCALSFNKVSDYLLENAKHIIVNSVAEKEHLIEKFGLKYSDKAHVVYNGTDINEKISEGDCNYLEKKYKLPSTFICCAGAIGPRKNQLNLVLAANQTNIPLIIIGKAAPGNMSYLKQIKKISKSNIYFIDQLSQQEIAYILTRSRGHIQPSFIETPGLASLEAASLNCPVCVSNVGPVREYFGESAIYVNPYDVESIKNGIEELYNGVRLHCDNFKQISCFQWENVLEKLLKYL